MQAEQCDDGHCRNEHGRDARIGQLLDRRSELLEHAIAGDGDAQDVPELTHGDGDAHSDLEADQDWAGDEVSDESEAEHTGEHENRPRQDGERGGRREWVGSLRCDCDRARGEERDRRRGADRQWPRGPEERIDDHRDECAIQTHLHWETGDRRVCDRLRQYDGGGRESGEQVQARERALVPGAPGGDRRGRDHNWSMTHRNPTFPAALSGVLPDRESTRYR
jgi:hypothetical protein